MRAPKLWFMWASGDETEDDWQLAFLQTLIQTSHWSRANVLKQASLLWFWSKVTNFAVGLVERELQERKIWNSLHLCFMWVGISKYWFCLSFDYSPHDWLVSMCNHILTIQFIYLLTSQCCKNLRGYQAIVLSEISPYETDWLFKVKVTDIYMPLLCNSL